MLCDVTDAVAQQLKEKSNSVEYLLCNRSSNPIEEVLVSFCNLKQFGAA